MWDEGVLVDTGRVFLSRTVAGPCKGLLHIRCVAEAAKARSGPSGLSAYVAAAVARQVERDNLNELIIVAEAEHGSITDEEVQGLRDQLHQARAQQTSGGASAA